MAETICVEVVYVPAHGAAFCAALTLPAAARVGDALRVSGLALQHPEALRVEGRIGIHARLVTADAALVDGDRVEVYRLLTQDPRETRRQRARR